MYMIPVGAPGYDLLGLDASKKFRFFGTVQRLVSRGTYAIKFDLLPTSHNTYSFARSAITVLGKDEDELPYTAKAREEEEMLEECSGVPDGNKGGGGKKNYEKESVDAFKALSPELKKAATTFTHRWGEKDNECISWKILGEMEQITTDPMGINNVSNGSEGGGGGGSSGTSSSGTDTSPTSGTGMSGTTDNPIYSPIKDEGMKWDPDPSKVDYNSLLFEKFFPPVKGKALVLDEFLSRPGRGTWKQRVQQSKIKFHRPEAKDPDELVSIFVVSFIIHLCTQLNYSFIFSTRLRYVSPSWYLLFCKLSVG